MIYIRDKNLSRNDSEEEVALITLVHSTSGINQALYVEKKILVARIRPNTLVGKFLQSVSVNP